MKDDHLGDYVAALRHGLERYFLEGEVTTADEAVMTTRPILAHPSLASARCKKTLA